MGVSGDMSFSAFHSPGLLARPGRIMHILSLSENVEVDKIFPRYLSLSLSFNSISKNEWKGLIFFFLGNNDKHKCLGDYEPDLVAVSKKKKCRTSSF